MKMIAPRWGNDDDNLYDKRKTFIHEEMLMTASYLLTTILLQTILNSVTLEISYTDQSRSKTYLLES